MSVTAHPTCRCRHPANGRAARRRTLDRRNFGLGSDGSVGSARLGAGGGEEGWCHSHQLWRELKAGRCREDCRERDSERTVNETDVIGLSEGVNCVNCQPKQRQTLIVSSAPSSRQVICRGAGEGGDGGIGEVEKGVFPFFLAKRGRRDGGRWRRRGVSLGST